ncbi:MAG: ABC transporter ATP-binding protein [Candidatus Omnitrophica bacterium]|nr:ABC transporter ATP-binding protein [Candidatus Omnitrophota bacterium]
MLKVKALTCGYGGRAVVSGVDLDVKSGEFFGLIGPNGSGKTTLLRALSRIIKPMAGDIALNGKALGKMAWREIARDVAVVSQQVPVAAMTVEEFVMLGRLPHFAQMQFLESAHDRNITRDCMATTGTLCFKDKPLQHLSGGERQLVQITRALVQQPKMLLLDEPTAHLDITHQVAVMGLLKRLVRELDVTVLMVLHDLNLASEYCDRLALVSEGRIYKTGTPQEVMERGIIEAVYKTTITVGKSPVSSKPYIFINTSKEEK